MTEPFPGKKFLVLRRDGTIPEWPWFVMGAEDPLAAGALYHYAGLCEEAGYSKEYVDMVMRAVDAMQSWAATKAMQRPDQAPPRKEDPSVLIKLDIVTPCRECRGSGRSCGINTCSACRGVGYFNKEKS